MTEGPSLLLVEDDEVLRERLARAFDQRGFEVRSAATAADARRLVADDPPEFTVLDLRLPDGSGLDLVSILVAADPATRIVVLTGYGSIATAIEAVRLGAVHYLTKPADADEIIVALGGHSREQGASVPTPSFQPMSLDRVEWEHISRVLVECGGNVSEAARVLGLHRRSLQRKLARHPPLR